MRHLFALLVLPFNVVVVIPFLLLQGSEALFSPCSVLGCVGLLLGLCGAWVFARCVSLFARRGRGTLAPWDPPRHLVIEGPYRYMRHPMIAGVLLMLIAEALVWRSLALGAWVLVFFLVNGLHFHFIEEPRLVRRFGDAYLRYKAGTPRWWPRPPRGPRGRP